MIILLILLVSTSYLYFFLYLLMLTLFNIFELVYHSYSNSSYRAKLLTLNTWRIKTNITQTLFNFCLNIGLLIII